MSVLVWFLYVFVGFCFSVFLCFGMFFVWAYYRPFGDYVFPILGFLSKSYLILVGCFWDEQGIRQRNVKRGLDGFCSSLNGLIADVMVL